MRLRTPDEPVRRLPAARQGPRRGRVVTSNLDGNDIDTDCDYCRRRPGVYLRFVGFIELAEARLPEVRLWCGECQTDDDIDMAALNAFLKRQGPE